jgi:hypothetical protein
MLLHPIGQLIRIGVGGIKKAALLRGRLSF